MTKLTKVEELIKKGERYYANRVHIDIYGKGVIAGFHSRDEEVKKLREALEYYANHESVIKEAYHTGVTPEQIQVVHTFINHVAKKALEETKDEK